MFSKSLCLTLVTVALSGFTAQAAPHRGQQDVQATCASASPSVIFKTVTVTARGSTSTSKSGSSSSGTSSGSSNSGKGNNGSSSSGNTSSGGSKGSTGGKGGSKGSTTTSSVSSSTTTKSSGGKGGSKGNSGTSTTTTSAAATTTSGNVAVDADPQKSLTLDPRVIAQGFLNDGQDVPTAGQVPSLTSGNNFINFCLTVPDLPLTNGKQIKTGSCNTAPIGVIPSTDHMPSSKFSNPINFGTIAANQAFTITMNINNLDAGHFVNAQENYFSAPQTLNDQGIIIGHTHVVMEQIESLTQTTATDPRTFAFFKGINTGPVNGAVSADVTAGVPPGTYRLCSINASSNHQPVIAPVAQHGSLDDCIYFTATTDGAATNSTTGAGSSAAASTVAATSAAASTTTNIVNTVSASSAAVTSTSTAIGNFGKCSVPQVEFGAGFDGRKETSFQPVDKASFNHGSAQNIDIITQFMCDQLTNSCGADATAKATCATAQKAADGATAKTGAQADAFNAVFGIKTNFAAVAVVDDQGNVVSGAGAGAGSTASASASASASATTSAAATATSAASNSGTSTGVGNFGKCSVPQIEFGTGFDGRKETAFQPVDKASFNHDSADNIAVITSFICNTLTNTCGADAQAKATCATAQQAASQATSLTGAQADAFNKVFGITTNFANVAVVDNTGKVVSGSAAGNANNNGAVSATSTAVAQTQASTEVPGKNGKGQAESASVSSTAAAQTDTATAVSGKNNGQKGQGNASASDSASTNAATSATNDNTNNKGNNRNGGR